jgi:hypothetical protein
MNGDEEITEHKVTCDNNNVKGVKRESGECAMRGELRVVN